MTKTMTPKLIKDTNQLSKESKNLAAHIKRSDTRIQLYLLSEIAHIEEHRNPTRLNDFFSAVKGSGARTHAMHSFIQSYANVQWVDKTDDKPAHYAMKPKRDAKAFKALFDSACADHWTSHKSEGKVIQFNLENRVTKLLIEAFKHDVTIEELEAEILRLKDSAKKAADEALAKAAKDQAPANEKEKEKN